MRTKFDKIAGSDFERASEDRRHIGDWMRTKFDKIAGSDFERAQHGP